MKKTPSTVIDTNLESKVVGNTVNSWQVLLIKWRKKYVINLEE